MNLVRLRNGKTRLLVGFGVGLVILVLTYVMHDTHTKLIISRGLVLECEHRQESLSAQLQVANERRTRLEKTMQQEKQTFKQTKEKLEAQYEELQEQTDKEKQETQNKFATLQQQHKALQKQHENIQEEFSKLQQTNTELQEEKQNFINKMTSEMDQLRMTKDEEVAQLQVSVAKLQQEKEEIITKLDQSRLVHQLQADLKSCMQKPAQHDARVILPAAVHPSSHLVHQEASSKVDPLKIPSINTKDNVVRSDIQKEKAAANPPGEKTHNQKIVPRLMQQPVNPPSNVLLPPRNYGRGRPSPIAQNVQEVNDGHQLANPQDAELKQNDDLHRQLEDPNRFERAANEAKKEQLAEPPPAGALNAGAAEHQDEREGALFQREAELVPNGLEQQENGDQDLDAIENEIVDEKKRANQFEDADFDQPEQDENDGNRSINNNNHKLPVKPEGVIAAPH